MLFVRFIFFSFLAFSLSLQSSNASVFQPSSTLQTITTVPTSYSTIDQTFPKNILPSTIYAEPYIYLNYSLASLGYGQSKLHSQLNNLMPLGFGGTIGFFIQDLLMLEFGMSGYNANIKNASDIGVSGGKSTFFSNHINLGLRLPLTKDYQIGLLLLGGVAFGMLHNEYKVSGSTVASNIPVTSFFVAPEFGGGLDYRLNQRVSFRSELKYMPTSSNPFIKKILRFSAGLQIKL